MVLNRYRNPVTNVPGSDPLLFNFNSIYGCSAEANFLPAGRKYHEASVSTRSSSAGNVLYTGSPDTICEIIAPVIAKKKPA